MNEPPTEPQAHDAAQSLPWVPGDPALAAAAPVLRHLLVNDDRSLFSDEIVSRVRSMIAHVAAQLLFAQAEAAGVADSAAHIDTHQDELAAALCADDALLLHVHARAVEGRVTEQLQRRSGIDPVLTPLVHDFVASEDAETASRAMSLLAAQTRFMQHYRRMELPLRELPGELFHTALLVFRSYGEADENSDEVEHRLRQGYDEATGRLALLTRLAMAAEGVAVLKLDHAGVALFVSALAQAVDQPRDLTVLALTEGELPRLVARLRAAGLSPEELQVQLLHLHPDGEFLQPADHSSR